MYLHESIKQNSNRYLCFAVGNERFALHVAIVTGILEMQQITTVPNCPSYMNGIINLKGTLLPILDLRKFLGVDDNQITANTCILVLDIVRDGELTLAGLLVDSVTEVFELLPHEILPPPSMSNNTSVSGIAKIPDSFVLLLDVTSLFGNQQNRLIGLAC